MSALSHWVSRHASVNGTVPAAANGSVFRLAVPKGLVRRRVWCGAAIGSVSHIATGFIKSKVVFRLAGETVLELPYNWADDLGGENNLSAFPALPDSAGSFGTNTDCLTVNNPDGIVCQVPGLRLRIDCDEIDWLLTDATSTISGAAAGTLFLACLSEAEV